MKIVDYSKLLKTFWEKRLVCSLTSCEADMYYYLLKQCDLGNWANPFKLPTKKCEVELDFTRKTISNVRNSLQQKGFINFKPSKVRGEIAEYEIIGLDVFIMETQSGTQTETQSGTQTETQSGTQTETQSGTQTETQKEKRKENLPHTPTKENKKESLKEVEREKDELSLFSTTQERQNEFLRSLQPYVSRYGQKLIDDFAAYWTCMGKDDTHMRFEKEPKFSIVGRLATWSKNGLRYNGNTVLSVSQKEKQYGIDWEKVLGWYNKLGLVEIKVLTDKRKLAYIAAYETHGKEGIAAFSTNVKESDYLLGRNGKGPKRDFDYVFNETNFARIIEGSYRNFKNASDGNNLRKESDAPRYKSKDIYDTGFGSSHGK